MADKDEKTGRFLPGHKVNQGKTKETIEFNLEEAKKIIKEIDMFGNMPLSQINSYMADKERLNPRRAGIIKFWQKFMQHGDVNRLKLLLNVKGVPTDVKAVGIQDIESMMSKDEDGARDVNAPKMTKEKRLAMLDKYKKIIELSEDD
jgi:hypothetical protein